MNERKKITWTEKYNGALKPGDRIYKINTVLKIEMMHYNFRNDTVTYTAIEDWDYIRRMQNL